MIKQENGQKVNEKVSEQQKTRIFQAIGRYQRQQKQGRKSPYRGKRSRSSTRDLSLE